MTSIPAWLAAAAGQNTVAGQINQFLGAHPCTYLYQGTSQSSQTTAGTGNVGSFGLYLAQKFITGAAQTQLGYVTLSIANTATAPTSTLQVSIYASSGGAPTGSPLITVNAAPEYVGYLTGLIMFPVPLTVTAATTYFIVTAPSGQSGTQQYQWSKSNQTSGAYTSTTGTAWTSQTYGLLYNEFDQSPVGPLVATWGDAGARWCGLTYNTSGTVKTLSEYTAAQGGGYLQGNRTFTYSGIQLIGVS